MIPPPSEQYPPISPTVAAAATPQYWNMSPAIIAAHKEVEERELKRRISHSNMERRRRERTNNIINELKDLVPWLRNESRTQKLEVLEQCVVYIKSLQEKHGDSAKHMSPPSADNLLPPAPKRQRNQYSAPVVAFKRQKSSDADSQQTIVSGHSVAQQNHPNNNNCCWNVVTATPALGNANDLPELIPDSGAASKASSTVSTITPFRGPLADHLLSQCKPKDSENSKSSINFLTN